MRLLRTYLSGGDPTEWHYYERLCWDWKNGFLKGTMRRWTGHQWEYREPTLAEYEDWKSTGFW